MCEGKGTVIFKCYKIGICIANLKNHEITQD